MLVLNAPLPIALRADNIAFDGTGGICGQNKADGVHYAVIRYPSIRVCLTLIISFLFLKVGQMNERTYR